MVFPLFWRALFWSSMSVCFNSYLLDVYFIHHFGGSGYFRPGFYFFRPVSSLWSLWTACLLMPVQQDNLFPK